MKKLFIVTGTPLGEYVTNDWLNAAEVWNENISHGRGAELALDAKRKQLKEAENEGLLHTGRGDEDREVQADGQ